MSSNGKKVIIITPSGRKRYLILLLEHLKAQKSFFDEWHLWNNTRNKEDEDYLYTLEKQHDWIRVIDTPTISAYKGENRGINMFWNTYTFLDHVIYIRLDDDIIWLSPGFIQSMIQFKNKHDTTPVVVANTINNNYIAHFQQKTGRVLQSVEPIDKLCIGNLWKSPELTHKLHEEFLEDRLSNTYDKWKINDVVVDNYLRVSINALAFDGSIFKSNKIDVHDSEEEWVSIHIPYKYKKPVIINGDALALHFAYFTQRDVKVNGKSLDDRLEELTVNMF